MLFAHENVAQILIIFYLVAFEFISVYVRKIHKAFIRICNRNWCTNLNFIIKLFNICIVHSHATSAHVFSNAAFIVIAVNAVCIHHTYRSHLTLTNVFLTDCEDRRQEYVLYNKDDF